jgi:hypothetical protein
MINIKEKFVSIQYPDYASFKNLRAQNRVENYNNQLKHLQTVKICL